MTQKKKTTPKGNSTVWAKSLNSGQLWGYLASDPVQLQLHRDLQNCRVVSENAK